MQSRSRGRRAGSERGETLVEFAVAGIVFFMLVFGTVEMGMVVWQYDFVSSLAQDGARWASVHGATSLRPASAADVQTYVQTRSLGRTVGVVTTPAPSAVSPGGTVNVVVQESMAPLSAFLPQVRFQLRGTAQMVVAR